MYICMYKYGIGAAARVATVVEHKGGSVRDMRIMYTYRCILYVYINNGNAVISAACAATVLEHTGGSILFDIQISQCVYIIIIKKILQFTDAYITIHRNCEKFSQFTHSHMCKMTVELT